jgi:hypothetical protein
MDILKLLWIIGFIFPIIVLGMYFGLFWFFERSRNVKGFAALLSSAVLLFFLLWFFIVYFIGSGFGPGVPLCTSSFLVGVVLSIIFFSRRSSQDNARFARLLTITKVALVFSFVLPPIFSYITWNRCDAYHREVASDVIQAMEIYKQNHDNFPDSLDALVPTYVTEIPRAICLKPYNWISDILFSKSPTDTSHDISRFYLCEFRNQTFLAIEGTAVGFTHLYDFQKREWHTIDFLDGECMPTE